MMSSTTTQTTIHDQVKTFYEDVRTLRLSGGLSTSTINKRLSQAAEYESITSLSCARISFDENILPNLDQFLSRDRWDHIQCCFCRGDLAHVLRFISENTLVTRLTIVTSTSTSTSTSATELDSETFAMLGKCLSAIQIVKLHVTFPPESVDALRAGLALTTSLAELDLSGSIWRDSFSAFCDLAQDIQTVTKISLSRCKLSDRNLAHFVRSVAHNPALRDLDLSQNSCKTLTLESLANALNHRLCLWTHLSITCNDLSEDAMPGLELFLHSLRANCHLEQLCMAKYMIQEEAMSSLVSSLGCGVSPEAARMLGSNLARFRHLQHLAIPSSETISIDLLVDGMQHNTSLLSIEMFPGCLDMPQLNYLLDLNQGGRRIVLDNTTIPISVWPVILERAGKCVYINNRERQADVIYYLLSKKMLLER